MIATINEDFSVFVIEISSKRNYCVPIYARESFDLPNFFVVNYEI